MTKRPTLSDIVNILTSSITINNNNNNIEAAFDNTLSRDGSTPNQMEADLDLNSNDLTNVNTGNFEDILVKGVSISSNVSAAAASALAASLSEAEAEASKLAAAVSAASAATSEANALTSETNAALSESNASASETAAGLSETAAALSETNAAASESSAAISETNASTSETNAATSETNAAISEAAAAASYDNFDDRYLGAKAADPALDNDGAALITGALYFNSTDGDMRIWTGAVWISASIAGLTATVAELNGLVDNGASYRNLIINGEMQVAQRGTSATGPSTAGYYTCDRWLFRASTGFGVWTITQESDGPDGFANSFKVACTTADATPTAAEFVAVEHRLTGRDLQRLKKGTAAAKSVTLQKRVKSNVTGVYQVNLRDLANNRTIGATYTISSANTWEQVTLTFAEDTTGAFVNDNTAGLILQWFLDAGTNYTTGAVPTAWEALAVTDLAAGSTVNLADTIGNYWQITGVQLEEGSVATAFEHMSYDEHLHRCLPYYYRINWEANFQHLSTAMCASTTLATGGIFFPVPMIAAPHTFETSGVAGEYVVTDSSTSRACTAVPSVASTTKGCTLNFTTTGLTLGRAALLRFYNVSSTVFLAWSAEL